METARQSRAGPSRVHQKRQKACDACHRRKIRCNGEEGGPNPCSYCVKNGYDCTYNHRPNKWPPSKTYVDGLEERVGHLERRVDFLKRELAKARNDPSRSGLSSSDEEDADDWSPRKEEDEDEETQEALRAITEGYEDLWLGNPTGMRVTQEPRMFHGRSSHFQIVNHQIAEMGSKNLDKRKFFTLRVRPEFRLIDPDIFDEVDLRTSPPAWPEPDLAMTLINAFFDRYNSVMPLLHRPTFMRQYGDPAMRIDREWVAIAFGVFALAAKYVDDPRVLHKPASKYAHDAGLKYWNEMRRIGSALYAPPSLYRLQALILFTYFLGGSALFPSAGWALVGLGLRYVQDAGMHLKKEWLNRAKAHPFEYEMRKRVFWILYMMERTMALEMDRSFCLPEDDYDVDPLLELDDAALDLLQQGKMNAVGYSPSVAGYNVRIRLLQFASRKRDEFYAYRNQPTNAETIARDRAYLNSIVSRLQTIRGTLPKDLDYRADEPNREILQQGGLIHVHHHWVQLILFRPFCSTLKRKTHSDVPILAISTEASRNVAQVLEVFRNNGLLLGRVHETSLAGFVAGSVLVMNMWEKKGLDGTAEIEMCLNALQALEYRWQFPGLMYDVLKNFYDIMKTVLGNLAAFNHAPLVTPNDGVTDTSTIDNLPPPRSALFTEEEAFTQSLSAGLTNHFFNGQQEFAAIPSTADQPMFGEYGWLNNVPFGGHAFMDPQFDVWLDSMLLSTSHTDQTDGTVPDSAWLNNLPIPDFPQGPV